MDRRTQAAVQRLAKLPSAPEALPPQVDPPAIPATAGLGQDARAAASGGSGIASPLTEISRSLHATQAVSSDGLFVWSVPDTIVMVDAAGRVVEFVYAAP